MSRSLKVDQAFQKIFNAALSRSRWILAFTVVFTGLSIWAISHIRLELDLYDILDPSLKSSQNQWTMRQEFADINSVFVSLYSDRELKARDICELKKFSIHYFNESNEIERITAPWSLRAPSREESRLWYRPFLPDPCALDRAQAYTPLLEKLETTPWNFFFNGKNPNQISLDVAFKEQIDRDGNKKFDVIVIDHFVKALEVFLKENTIKFDYHIFGHVSLRWHIMQTLKSDFIWNIGIIIFIATFFYFFLGTWRAGFYYTLTLLITDIFLFGTMSFIGFPIDLMANCLILMMAVAGVSDFLFISSAQKENEPWIKSFLEVVTPSFFTSTTTVLGFISLGFVSIPAISRFGYAAALGATFEWIATFIILPAALRFFKVEKTWVRENKTVQIRAAWFIKLNQFVPGRLLTTGLLILSFVCGLGLYHLNIGDNILQNFPSNHPVRKAYHWLKEDKAWQGQVFLMFEPTTSREQISEKLKQIQNLEGLHHIDNPLAIEDFMTQGFSSSMRELILREMSMGPMKHYRSSHDYLRVPLYTTSMDLAVLRKLMGGIESICETQCFLTGQTVVYLEYSDRISKSLVDSLGFSLLTVAITVLLIAYLRRSPHNISLIFSSVWAPLIMMGFLWLFQVPVTSVTSIFFALIVGWTGDNAIQYMFANEDILQGASARASATLMQTLLFMGSSLFFTFHSFVPIKILGYLFVIGFAMTYVGDLWLLKGLIMFRKSRSNVNDSLPLSSGEKSVDKP